MLGVCAGKAIQLRGSQEFGYLIKLAASLLAVIFVPSADAQTTSVLAGESWSWRLDKAMANGAVNAELKEKDQTWTRPTG